MLRLLFVVTVCGKSCLVQYVWISPGSSTRFYSYFYVPCGSDLCRDT